MNLSSDDGWTASMFASSRGLDDVTKSLIKADASLDMTDDAGETALMVATRFGNFGIALKLIQAGADTEIVDKGGETALTCVVDGMCNNKSWMVDNDQEETLNRVLFYLSGVASNVNAKKYLTKREKMEDQMYDSSDSSNDSDTSETSDTTETETD